MIKSFLHDESTLIKRVQMCKRESVIEQVFVDFDEEDVDAVVAADELSPLPPGLRLACC